jgi:hypothetical protein
LLIFTFFIQTKMIRYTLVVYPAIAVTVAYFILYVLEQLRWGKPLFIVSGCIALVVFVFQQDIFPKDNTDLRTLGLAVQRYARDSQPVVVFRITEPGLGFYCRRPVRWVWSPEEVGPLVQQGSLLITDKADLLAGLLDQQGFTWRVLYQGATYTLMAPSQIPKSTASVTASGHTGSILSLTYLRNRDSTQFRPQLIRARFLSAPAQKFPPS